MVAMAIGKTIAIQAIVPKVSETSLAWIYSNAMVFSSRKELRYSDPSSGLTATFSHVTAGEGRAYALARR